VLVGAAVDDPGAGGSDVGGNQRRKGRLADAGLAHDDGQRRCPAETAGDGTAQHIPLGSPADDAWRSVDTHTRSVPPACGRSGTNRRGDPELTGSHPVSIPVPATRARW
jgi:hypothetical protein